MDEKKKVSVVMCTYNGEKYIREQIDSILTQTYPIYELIIQDDGSTDGTVEIIKEYQHADKRIKLFCNEISLGINANFFSAMRKAKSEYIAISDQDDIWESDKIAIQVESIGDKLLCTGRSVPFVEGYGKLVYDWRYPNHNLICLLYASIPGHTMLIRRSILDLIPQEHEFYKYTLYDVILSITAASYNSLVFVDKKIVNHRRHLSAATYQTKDKHRDRSILNAFYLLYWSIMHYQKARPLQRNHFRVRHSFLMELNSHEEIFLDALQMTECLASSGLISKLKLMRIYLKYRHVLFFTYEKDPIAIVRAILYPIMLIYNYRPVLDKQREQCKNK